MISIVIPLYNEEESLHALYKALLYVLTKQRQEYEIIFIDDGSTDGSLTILKQIEKENKYVRIFSFRRNQGKAEALTLGFLKAKGSIVVTLDADLQDIPSEMPKLIEKLQEGWDAVCGWRKYRKDAIPKVFSSKIFNLIARKFWGLRLHDYNGGLKAYTQEAAKSLHLYGGLHRFIPLILHQQGFTVCEIVVSHELRKFGKSKYGFSKIWRDLPDIFTMIFLAKYGKQPLHFFGMVGIFLLVMGIGILGYLSFLHFEGQTIGSRPLLFLGMLLVLSGFQIFFTGFLADIIINISYRYEKDEKKNDFVLRYNSD